MPKESSKGSEVPATREVLGTGNPDSEEMGVDKGEEAWISSVPEGQRLEIEYEIDEKTYLEALVEEKEAYHVPLVHPRV